MASQSDYCDLLRSWVKVMFLLNNFEGSMLTIFLLIYSKNHIPVILIASPRSPSSLQCLKLYTPLANSLYRSYEFTKWERHFYYPNCHHRLPFGKTGHFISILVVQTWSMFYFKSRLQWVEASLCEEFCWAFSNNIHLCDYRSVRILKLESSTSGLNMKTDQDKVLASLSFRVISSLCITQWTLLVIDRLQYAHVISL